MKYVVLFSVILCIINSCSCRPFAEINNDFTQSEEEAGEPYYGLVLYAPDEEMPTCMAHGFIYDEKKRNTFSTESFSRNKKWAEATLKKHNSERIRLGYNPVILSQNLSKISYAYAELTLAKSPDLKRSPDFIKNKSFGGFNAMYEETYYNEILHFQAPDENEQTTRACCPAPFTRMLSNDSKEIGFSRIVENIAGNFKKMIVVGIFRPNSNKWTATGQCETNEQLMRNAMHDSSETYADEYYDDDDNRSNFESSSEENGSEVTLLDSVELHV